MSDRLGPDEKVNRGLNFFRVSRYGFYSIAVSTPAPSPLSFAALSQRLKHKFKHAGIRAGETARSAEDAERLFLQIPKFFRVDEVEISRFLANKDASHIKSHGGIVVKDGVNRLNSSENILWENAKTNRKRGGKDMTQKEISSVLVLTAKDARLTLLRQATFNGIRMGLLGCCLDLPLVCLDEAIEHDEISVSKVVRSLAKTFVVTSGTGFVLYLITAQISESYEIEIVCRGLSIVGAISWLAALSSRIQLFNKLRASSQDKRKIVVLVV